MKTVYIILPEHAKAGMVTGAYRMFFTVNEILMHAGYSPCFDLKLVGRESSVKNKSESLTFHSDVLLKDSGKADLVIIPGVNGSIKEVIAQNKDFVSWISKQYRNGAEIASLCTGSFLLGATGLLKGKVCSTHWLYANEFKMLFPDVKLEDERVITSYNGLYTSGGATIFWNLLLYLIEKFTCREIAITISKYFLVDIDKMSQLPFSIFKGQKEHGDKLIMAAQEYIEEHALDKLNLEDIAKKFNLTRRTFERRFKKATSKTATEYLQRVRVEAAKKQLEAGRKTVNEVMYGVGYSDTKAFRDVFKRFTGMSPVDYRQKYHNSFLS